MKRLLYILIVLLTGLTATAQTQITTLKVNTDTLKGRGTDTIYVKNILKFPNGQSFNGTSNTDTSIIATKTYVNYAIDSAVGDLPFPDSSVVFVGSNGRLTTDSANFVWDNVNKTFTTSGQIRAGNPLYSAFNFAANNPFSGSLNIGGPAVLNEAFVFTHYGVGQRPVYRLIRSNGSYASPSSVVAGNIIYSMQSSVYSNSTNTFIASGLPHIEIDMEDSAIATYRTRMRLSASAGGVSTSLHVKSSGILVGNNSVPITTANLGRFQVNGSGATSATYSGYFQNSASNVTMVMRDDRRVGIKTATPSFDLDVDGTARIATTPRGLTTDSVLVKDASTGQIEAITPSQLVSSVTGWAAYTDTGYTVASPFTIAPATTDTLENRAQFVVSELPLGVSAFYSSANKEITPADTNDYYILSIRFKAKTTAVNDYMDILFGPDGVTNPFESQTLPFIKGAGMEQQFTVNFGFYSGALVTANGGKIRITTNTGTASIYDITYKITRTHKAR